MAREQPDPGNRGLVSLCRYFVWARKRGAIIDSLFEMLEKLRAGDRSASNKLFFDRHKENLGYGLLLKRYTEQVVDATDQQIKQAARDTIPNVAAMFWSFRIMVGLGFYMLALIGLSFGQFCAWMVEDASCNR